MSSYTSSRQWHLVARPHGRPAPSDFALREHKILPPEAGQILVRNQFLSVDPYMRRRMDDVESYVPPFGLDEPMDGGAVGVVVASECDEIAVGTYVQHMLGWREYALLDATEVTVIDADAAPLSAYLGVLGTTGLTAYAGLSRIARLQPGETVFVSGAAGAVGSQVGQIARLMGASRVIGSAGSADKVRLLVEEYGFDEAFDYHDGPVVDQLRAAAPYGIDVYFDNVGGAHLEAAIDVLDVRGRIVLCGMISQYNRTEATAAPRNLILAINKRLSLEGMLARDHADLRTEFVAKAVDWLASGQLRHRETVAEGIAATADAFLDMLAGGNTGKMLVRLAGEPLGFDPEALRAKYRFERDRRIRPDGAAQYRRTDGESGYYADDPDDPIFDRPPLRNRVEVAVIGGGFGGLLTGARLRQAGVGDIRMIEEGGDFGGAWHWNRYPGIHCDIESYVYLPLLEELGYVPEWKYAPGEEIRQHARAIGRHFDLYRDACFQTRVSELRWDEDGREWVISTNRGDHMRARYVAIASGTLSQPKLPGIPGIETFGGHTFHTSRWDYDYTGGDAGGGLTRLADKRIALVGTGATAVQVVPHLGRDSRHLYVLQRTPSSVDVRGNRRTDPAWAESLRGGWQEQRRDNFLTIVSGGQTDEDLVSDGWTGSAQLLRRLMPSASFTQLPPERREHVEEMVDFQKMNELRARVDEVVRDRATAEALKPWYRYMCKRPTFSDTYLETFNRPNVTLVDTADEGGVQRVTRDAVVVGEHQYEVDCIIFSTGFDVGISGVLSDRLSVHGRGGVTLAQCWRDGPRTLHGFASHGFPNLFHLGPLQNARSVNFTHILDEQARHVAAVIAEARRRGARYVEPTEQAQTDWVATIRATAPDEYKFQAECTPGYYNNEGQPRSRSETYGEGPLAFHALLQQWRSTGMDDVLVDAPTQR